MRITIVLCLTAFLLSCKAPEPQFDSNQPAERSLSSERLYEKYEANEVAADRTYKGMLLEVTGIVTTISKDLLGRGAFVVLNGLETSQMLPVGVQCNFRSSEEDKLIPLKKGQKISVKGICEGLRISVQLMDCVLTANH